MLSYIRVVMFYIYSKLYTHTVLYVLSSKSINVLIIQISNLVCVLHEFYSIIFISFICANYSNLVVSFN